MIYRGRAIDPVALWSNYVDFPPNMDESGSFLPLVQCPNPEHATLKKHFQINVEQPLVHCFAGCGISGTYENAIMMIEGCKREQARKTILRFSRIGHGVGGRATAPRRAEGAHAIATVPDLALYSFLPSTALDYLAGRGISGSSISKWELGWNSESLRITIPAYDLRGRLRFVIERAVKPKQLPRYLYPEHADKKNLLFGACHLDRERVSSWGVIVVEGSFDAIRLDQHGIGPVVAILGSVISGKQTEILASLRPKRVFTMFDMDAAGVTATFHLRSVLRSSPVFVCRYPRGFHDPAELPRREAERVVDKAVPFSSFQARATKLMKGA
jgi:DNA primase